MLSSKQHDGGRVAGGGLSLPPGFRFHPTDEEVIVHYLLPKVLYPAFACRAVTVVDIYSCEPRDLPSEARMGEKEWYFFVPKGLKYPTSSRANRATKEGYWKSTGRDKDIFGECTRELIGMKKSLVFYMGRAPAGVKTDWVMHEFRLHGRTRDWVIVNGQKDEWVVCKVFNKGEWEADSNPLENPDSVGADELDVGASGELDLSGVEGYDLELDSIPELDQELLDYIKDLDPFTSYQLNENHQLPEANTTTNAGTIDALPPYNMGCYSYTVPTTAGMPSFVVNPTGMIMPSLTNNVNVAISSIHQSANATTMAASSVPGSSNGAGAGSSWNVRQNLPNYGVGLGRSFFNGISLQEEQAVMADALGGLLSGAGPSSGVTPTMGSLLPSSAAAIASLPSPQQSTMEIYNDGGYPSYGVYAPDVAAGAAKDFGGRLH
ncbi:NAC domain-containing protein 77-like [Brachypodium distachyon]|uniref:NAC domain-containing protein n=1 Tax=Brachypodium distachyon TaxID=15368 RepID=A0A0Q3EYP3_BRADI|nr:NAC domain-containing protein 77-like [Brachypodium distachyon]KQJ92487.1 hypothetical protein BRADI_4g43995v3 [Brachypodium distachyon]|eukprot:XP_024318518.1 NAC domain-containing protein 77-like [Brachypodium distachyon]